MRIEAESLEYLRDLTRATVDASRVAPGQRVGPSPPNTTGATLIRPGARDCYPAYWVRDFAMALDAGFITPDEIAHHLRLTARTQNGPDQRVLRDEAAVIPPYAVADHVNFDGAPVFYPGTMSPGEDQGGEPFGTLPPICDHYYFIDLAHHLWKATGSPDFLHDRVDDLSLFDRLRAAFDVPAMDPATGVVTTTADRRAVGFGFYDIVHLTGSLLFPTLLRWRAASQLADLAGAIGRGDEAAHQRTTAGAIRSHLASVFATPDYGWLIASTGSGQQPDVWGTLYALHLDLLSDEVHDRAVRTVAAAVRAGTIVHDGGVRHLPTDFDHSQESAWQQTAPGVARDTYQNGAYWHTPTGWLVSALHRAEPALATAILDNYVRHLRADDFRKGLACGAPWECYGKGGQHRQNPVYMASVAVPYAVLRDLAASEDR